ncbi:hypothetical protein F4777DRAFT_597741 [Nemania sp. FL0916]|nr:hypothetical protein F4777DRAFT_597741 [Nemania sp. FL0916]
MEYVLDTTCEVPLFEFRDIGASTASEFERLVAAAERDIIDYHGRYRMAPTRPSSRRLKGRGKRQLTQCSANMTSSAPISTPVETSITHNITSSVTSTTTTTPESTPVKTSSTDTITSFVTSTATTPQITPAPSVSCSLQDQDPDQGITERYCICSGSITAPVLGETLAPTELCAYTALPTSTESVSIPTLTWTSNCKACTLVGGIADDPTCTGVSGCTPTRPPTPSITAWINNLETIDIGDAEDGNGGKDLANELYNGLKSVCDDKGCDDDNYVVMENVETIVHEGEEPIKPIMKVIDAVYHNDTATFQRMLSLGIATWVNTLNNNTAQLCKDVEYEAEEDETGSGCGKGPIPADRLRRKVRRDTGEVLWERSDLALEERCIDQCGTPPVCHYKGRICSAPTHIDVLLTGPRPDDANRLGLAVALKETGAGISCEEIVMVFTDILEVIAPELISEEVAGELGLDAICGIIPT